MFGGKVKENLEIFIQIQYPLNKDIHSMKVDLDAERLPEKLSSKNKFNRPKSRYSVPKLSRNNETSKILDDGNEKFSPRKLNLNENKFIDYSVKRLGNDLFRVRYIAEVPGRYKLNIKINNELVDKSPFNVVVVPGDIVKVYGKGVEGDHIDFAKLEEEKYKHEFTIDSGLKMGGFSDEIDIKILSPAKRGIDHTLRDVGNGKYKVCYQSDEQGEHLVGIRMWGFEVLDVQKPIFSNKISSPLEIANGVLSLKLNFKDVSGEPKITGGDKTSAFMTFKNSTKMQKIETIDHKNGYYSANVKFPEKLDSVVKGKINFIVNDDSSLNPFYFCLSNNPFLHFDSDEKFENDPNPENVKMAENDQNPENVKMTENDIMAENYQNPENVKMTENDIMAENDQNPENRKMAENYQNPENHKMAENDIMAENDQNPENDKIAKRDKNIEEDEDFETENDSIEECENSEEDFARDEIPLKQKTDFIDEKSEQKETKNNIDSDISEVKSEQRENSDVENIKPKNEERRLTEEEVVITEQTESANAVHLDRKKSFRLLSKSNDDEPKKDKERTRKLFDFW
ncbi:hypothetical protein MHBO_002718 [Bonamia ostreae]|uniref:Uncharacterized protein n=1 Tax=Bonamia ostreae TaxID=126728 RepID=A0ABV2AP80_9EUKA